MFFRIAYSFFQDNVETYFTAFDVCYLTKFLMLAK